MTSSRMSVVEGWGGTGKVASAAVAALVSVMVLAGCSGSSDPTTPAYWIDQLDDTTQRTKALRELGKLGDAVATPAVLELFQEEGEWQPDAAYTLGQLGDMSVVPELVRAIDYQAGSGRDRATMLKNRINQNIARALAMLKAKEGVEPLVTLLDSREDRTREAVLKSLGALGDSRAADPIIEIVLKEKQPFIRKVAIQALGNIGDVKAAPALVQMLYIEMPGTSFYYEARFALLQIGKAAMPELTKTLQRKNAVVEKITLPSGSAVAPGAIEAKAAFVLGAMRATEAEGLMIGAMNKFYGEFSHSTVDKPVYASIPGAVMELAFALGSLGSPNAISALEPIALETDANVRVASTEALTQLGARRSVPTLLKAAKVGSATARHHAIEAVSHLAGAEHLKQFDALAAGDKTVKAETMKRMLTEVRPRLEAAKECNGTSACWAKKIGDLNVDSKVRERAAYELGWAKSAESMGALLTAAEDEDSKVRMAAVVSLGNLKAGTVSTDTLQKIHDTWNKKIEYKNVNAELRRLIARLDSTK